jgi:hypothetical protein
VDVDGFKSLRIGDNVQGAESDKFLGDEVHAEHGMELHKEVVFLAFQQDFHELGGCEVGGVEGHVKGIRCYE